MRAAQVVAVFVAVSAGGCGSHGSPRTTKASMGAQRPATSATASPQRLGPGDGSQTLHGRLPPLRRCSVPAEAAHGGLLNAAVGGGAYAARHVPCSSV